MHDFLSYLIVLAASTLGGIIVLLIGLTYLWNKRYIPYRQTNGRPTDKFGRILSRLIRFVFKEETGSIFQKPSTDPTKPPKQINPVLQKVTYRKTYLFLLLVALVLAVAAKSIFALVPIGLLLLIIWGRTAPIFQARHKILIKMFEVASSEFKYGRGAEMNPWNYVSVQKWENLTMPAKIVVTFPTSFAAHNMGSREAFERHFNGTVTEENTWLYNWKNTDNQVIAQPVEHLPTKASYKGSEKFDWNVFPVGVGADGPISYDVMKTPHVLLGGPTGTGKSVIQRNMVFHCIQHNDMWRFVGVDIKRVELSVFKKYTKTVKGIATDLETGVELVRQIRDTMMERYTIMEDAGVNNFINLKDENGQMPKAILLMIDEAYMFLAPEGAKTDEGKQRDQWHGEAVTMLGEILRLGRASGVFMVMATQRPDASVIPGEMRANMDVRIAAGRMDSTPSSMILDSGAATLLPGHIKGRGALRSLGEISQFQGYFAEEEWIREWLKDNKEREPELFGLPDLEDQAASAEEAMDFVPDAQLQFEMDREMEELLAGDTKPDYSGAVVEGNNLPEGPGEDYVRTRVDPERVTPAAREQEEATVLNIPAAAPVTSNPFMLDEEVEDEPAIITPPRVVPPPAPATPATKPSLPPRPQRPAFPARPKFPGANN